MNRQDTLLKEYEVCQEHNNSITNHYWLIAAIFVSVNTAVLGGILYAMASNSVATAVNARWPVSALGIGIIFIIALLWRYFNRVNFIISLNYYRMRQIEIELGMRKNWLVHVLDHWDRLSDEQRGRFAHLRSNYPSRPWWQFWRGDPRYVSPTGRRNIKGIYFVLILLWLFFIIWMWFIYKPTAGVYA